MKTSKKILLLIQILILYFLSWMWEDHRVWSVLIITILGSTFFTDPRISFLVFLIYAIPGSFISLMIWWEKRDNMIGRYGKAEYRISREKDQEARFKRIIEKYYKN